MLRGVKCIKLVVARPNNRWRWQFSRRMSTSSDQPEYVVVRVRHLTQKLEGTTVFELNRPRVRNAINFPMMKELQGAIDDVRKMDDVTSVILRSGHRGFFCAGADLKERRALTEDEYKRWSLTVRRTFQDLASLPVPLLAAVDGLALGGGLELSLTADIRVAASSVDLIGLPETALGIIPGAGGTQRLCRLIGPSAAKELLFTGRRIAAPEALRLGIMNHVVEQNQDGDAAYQKCLDIAENLLRDRSLSQRVKTNVMYKTGEL